MKELATLLIATTTTILTLFSTIDRARSATLLFNNDRRPIFSYETLLREYPNLNFSEYRENNRAIDRERKTGNTRKNTEAIDRSFNQSQVSIIFADDPEAKIKSQKILDNFLNTTTNNHTFSVANNSSIAPFSQISNKPNTLVLYDNNSPIVQSKKTLDNLLDAKVDRSLSTINTISDPISNVPQSENTIVANNLIISENNDNFDRLPTPLVFLFSISIYGGIIIIVVIQIAMKTGTNLSTILYWFRTLTQPQLIPKKKSASIFSKTTPNRYIENLATRQKMVDRELEEFKKITNSLEKQTTEDNYLKNAIEIIKTALDNKQSLATLDRYEATYRSSKQQQFYNFVMETIVDIVEHKQLNFYFFQDRVEQKLQEIIAQTRTDVGRQALREYTKDLYKVASTQLGLKLVYLLKQSQTNSYSILDTIFDLVNEASKVDLLNVQTLKELVNIHWETLDKFGKVINLTVVQNVPATYIKILQYVGLYYKFKLDI